MVAYGDHQNRQCYNYDFPYNSYSVVRGIEVGGVTNKIGQKIYRKCVNSNSALHSSSRICVDLKCHNLSHFWSSIRHGIIFAIF